MHAQEHQKSIGPLTFFWRKTFSARKLGSDGLAELCEQRARRLEKHGKYAAAAKKFSEGAKFATSNEKKVKLHSLAAQAWTSASKHYPATVSESKHDSMETLAHMAKLLRNAKTEYELAAANCIGEDQKAARQRMEALALQADQDARYLDAGQKPPSWRR